jgi:hypothetical protein
MSEAPEPTKTGTVTKKIAHRRGYMAIRTKTRGRIKRDRLPAHRAAAKAAWFQTGIYFHKELRDKRFTPEHAKLAGYAKRRGETLPFGSKEFKRAYYGRKFLSAELGGGPNRADPLVKSGKTRREAKAARITSTSKGSKATYPRIRFDSRGRVKPNQEFRRFTKPEIPKLADVYDSEYDQTYNENDK